MNVNIADMGDDDVTSEDEITKITPKRKINEYVKGKKRKTC